MNREEAKQILLPYRPGTDDAQDPDTAEALALASNDPELGRWLEEHHVRQAILREKFRSIVVPDGLMEQIISEHKAANRPAPVKRNRTLAMAAAAAIILVAFYVWHQPAREDAGLAEYQSQMASVIALGYGMDLTTNNVDGIRNFLKNQKAPADFALTEPLKQTPLAGCSVESWQDQKASLVCFHANSASTNASTSDLWLFVVDRKLVTDAPNDPTPRFSQVNKLAIATWTEGGKLYLLAQQGDGQELKKFL